MPSLTSGNFVAAANRDGQLPAGFPVHPGGTIDISPMLQLWGRSTKIGLGDQTSICVLPAKKRGRTLYLIVVLYSTLSQLPAPTVDDFGSLQRPRTPPRTFSLL